jgi:membrane protein YdbS with pleckstrin-like domain
MGFFLILGFVKIIITLFVVLYWLNAYYEIWPNSIIYKRGIIWKKEEKFPFGHIRSIKVEQGVFGKIFCYGTLSLYDYSLRRYATVYLIHNPVKYFHILDGLVPKAEKEKEILREHIVEKEEK